MPVVSIVTPCYNAEPFIADTIASVQNQTFEDWEHIVVDDGSTDASADIVQRAIDEDPTGRLRLHRQSNQGVSAARNRGLEVASSNSKYVVFVDAVPSALTTTPVKHSPRTTMRPAHYRKD